MEFERGVRERMEKEGWEEELRKRRVRGAETEQEEVAVANLKTMLSGPGS